jgi:OPT oligopeptide transporter protein
MSLTSYAVQLLAWGMGSAMATYLPKHTFNTFGYKWSFNPAPWNAKEHALIVVAYWGSVSAIENIGSPVANLNSATQLMVLVHCLQWNFTMVER